MEIYISINGVLRNFIQKFDYHYRNYFMESDVEESERSEISHDYNVSDHVYNDDLLTYYSFQSKDEFNNFCYIDYALELFGHANSSYIGVISDLNKLIYDNKNINFTIIGVDEKGKAQPSTLFFLSKMGFMGNNIKFIKSENIEKEWKKCDLWITDSYDIIKKCPKNKIAVKFNTQYNCHFNYNLEINKLTEINEICLQSWENTTISTWMRLLNFAARITGLKGLMKKKN